MREWAVRGRTARRVVWGLLVLGLGPVGFSVSAEARLAPTLRGWVVDAETGRPIAAATVVRRPWVQCRAFHGASRALRAQEARTNARGYFAVGGRIEPPPCTVVDWGDELLILAPGYRIFRAVSYGSRDDSLERKLGPRPLRLIPARTAGERAEAADEAVAMLGLDGAGPVGRQAVVAARQQAGPEAAPHVLGRWPRARFARVAVVAEDGAPGGVVVVAHQGEAQPAVAWRLDGTLVGVRPWRAPVPSPGGIPGSLLPPKTSRVDCTGPGLEAGSVVIGAQTVQGPALLVLPRTGRAEPIGVPRGWLGGDVLKTCAGIPGVPRLWATTRPGEVLELDVAPSSGALGSRTWAVTGARVLETPALPPVWDLAAARHADGRERLYVVAGDERVYQLAVADLPVRRHELRPSSGAVSP